MKNVSIGLIVSALLSMPLPAFAERLTGQEVAQLMSGKPIRFVAGSEWRTLPNGRYVFSHNNSSEEGTFKVFSNGTVEILDEKSGRKIRFYFDLGADGTPALIYITGGGKGKRYPIK